MEEKAQPPGFAEMFAKGVRPPTTDVLSVTSSLNVTMNV
jgi:hypothetical protein